MHNIDRRRYDVLTRVRDFGVTYAHLFAEDTLAGQAFATVTTALADIKAQDVAETTAFVSARAAHKDEVRRELLERLSLIARTGRVLPGADANLKAHLELPDSPSDQLLLTTARQVVQEATPVMPQFMAHGMPKTFLTDLAALIEQFEEAVRDRGMSRSQMMAARAAIKTAMDTGFEAIRQLDVIVANHLAGNKEVRQVWKESRRLRRPSSRRSDEGTAAEDTATQPPAPAAPEGPAASV